MLTRAISAIIASASVIALMLTIRSIPHFGIYFDEALFAPVLYQPDSSHVHVEFFGLTLPVMVMGYVGALKLYLWKVIFAVASPSVWSLRFPMLLVATLCAGVWGHTLITLGAKRAASPSSRATSAAWHAKN